MDYTEVTYTSKIVQASNHIDYTIDKQTLSLLQSLHDRFYRLDFVMKYVKGLFKKKGIALDVAGVILGVGAAVPTSITVNPLLALVALVPMTIVKKYKDFKKYDLKIEKLNIALSVNNSILIHLNHSMRENGKWSMSDLEWIEKYEALINDLVPNLAHASYHKKYRDYVKKRFDLLV